MADIKTRDAVKGTIKTIDKAAIASERMKSAYVGIKEKTEQGYYADENSATEYAADRISYAADRVKDEGMEFAIANQRNYCSLSFNISSRNTCQFRSDLSCIVCHDKFNSFTVSENEKSLSCADCTHSCPVHSTICFS